MDAFLSGRLSILQPRDGFRAGLDSVLLGAAASPASGTLLDLGAGAGVAALVALAHNAQLRATLVENDPLALALAAENVKANGVSNRAAVLGLDVTAPGQVRSQAGLQTDHFETVIANPPYFEATAGTAPAALRRAARHMQPGDLDRWVRTAAAAASPGGEIIFILPASSLVLALQALEQRFGAIALLPLGAREGAPASRILVRGIKGSRAPLTLLQQRPLHGTGRDFSPEFDAIFRGQAVLIW